MMDFSDLTAADDRELLERMAEKDQKAFAVIYDRYWEELYQKAYRRLRDEAGAKDAVQNVFVSLWRRKSEVRIENLRAYLHGAVRFQVFRRVEKSTEFVAFSEPLEAMMISPFRADRNIIRDDLSRLLIAWIDTLPPKRRQVFIMHYQEQLSVKEIAARLGITRKTVYNQLHSSVSELQWKLSQYYTLAVVMMFYISYMF